MKNSRPFYRTIASVAVSALLVQSLGCAESFDDSQSELSQERNASLALSDEELFAEVMFPNATIAEKVPEFGRLYSSIDFENVEQPQADAMRLFQDATIANIRQLNPDFFPRFAADLRSNDPLRVRGALTEAGELMLGSLQMTSAHLDALTSPEKVDELALQFPSWEPSQHLIEYLENYDPGELQELLAMINEQLQTIDPGYDPSLGLAAIVETQVMESMENGSVDGIGIHKNTNIAVNKHAVVESYYLVAVAGAYVLVVAAFAAVAVVATIAVPFGPSAPLNGESMQLNQDQLVVHLAQTYAA